MCGIAGILNIYGLADQTELDRFTDALAHRGPDGRGTFTDRKLGLGHRRLAILDPGPAGSCPMAYGGPDGKRYWITYNGEIYYFLELRKELAGLGHQFKTETDTEVILAAYAEWGKECLHRFNGMWAFAIWDSRQQKLFLARDRFGVKPLYYHSGTRFAFASEIKAFLALDGFRPELNSEIVSLVINSSYAYEGITDQTMMKGIKRLPAGCCLTIGRDRKLNIEKWWNTADHIPLVPDTYEEQVARFRTIFLDAVRIRMRSDVPVGTCLSGGIDSGAVASAMAHNHRLNPAGLERCAPDWQRTFIATFPGSVLDEKKYAAQVADHINARPHYWVFDEKEALNNLLSSVWSMEEVYGGISVPIWSLYREMRRNGVYVSLDGHGGDELLCGYTWYLDWLMGDVNANLYADFHSELLPAILRNYDRCSMAHGIEVRMPLMDWRLVTFVFGLPAEAKIGAGNTRRILRDAMQGIMPEAIRTRKSKIGFNSPMIEWFNGGLATLLDRITSHPLWLEGPFWDGRKTQEAIRLKSGAWSICDWGESLQVWTMINIVLWQLLFIERKTPEEIREALQ